MPTSKPRVMLTLEPSDYQALTRLAELQGRPLATVLREFVTECSPVFNQIADALEAAQKMQKNASKDLLDKLETAHGKAAPVLLEMLEALEAVAASGTAQPPHSNTGVRFTN